MAVIVLILKIIGIVLLALLGLFLLVLGLLLFVPVRYRIHGRQEAGFDTASVKVCVTWLLHLVSWQFSYRAGEAESALRICGIRRRKKIPAADADEWDEEPDERTAEAYPGEDPGPEQAVELGFGEDPGPESAAGPGFGKDPGKESAAVGTDLREDAAEEQTVKPGTRESAAEERSVKPGTGDAAAEIQAVESECEEGARPGLGTRVAKKHTGNQTEKIDGESRISEKNSGSGIAGSEAGKAAGGSLPSVFGKIIAAIRSLLGRIFAWFRKIRALIQGIPGMLRRLRDAAARLRAKVADIRAMIADETNRTAVTMIFAELNYLLTHFRFRKIYADLSFSLGDPAATGQALGAVSILPFIYRYECDIYPDFASEEPYIRGECEIRGRARMLHVLRSLLRLIRRAEFRTFVKRIMNRRR